MLRHDGDTLEGRMLVPGAASGPAAEDEEEQAAAPSAGRAGATSRPSTRGRAFALAAARALGAQAARFCRTRAPATGSGAESVARHAAALAMGTAEAARAAQAEETRRLGRDVPAGLERIDRSWYLPPPPSRSDAAARHLRRAAYAQLAPMLDDVAASADATAQSDEGWGIAASADGGAAGDPHDASAQRAAASLAAGRPHDASAQHDGGTTTARAHDADAPRDLRAAVAAGPHDADAPRHLASTAGSPYDGRAPRTAAIHALAVVPPASLERALLALGRHRVALAFVGAPRAGLAQFCARIGEPAASALLAEVRALRAASPAAEDIKAAQRALFRGDENELRGEGVDEAHGLFLRVGAAWLAPALARLGDELRRAAQRLPRPLGQTLLDQAAAPSSDAERSVAWAHLANALLSDL